MEYINIVLLELIEVMKLIEKEKELTKMKILEIINKIN